jgi:hypothetical protein
MASIHRAPLHGPSGHLQTVGDEEANISNREQVERTRTVDTNIIPEKLTVEAKLDEFGARSKVDPQEIALVKKLDRTILVSSLRRSR